MKKLTQYQKEFLLNTFFKNEEFAGWKSIAEKLLENGECIVAGEDCIWKGGIGNFIQLEESPDEFYNCVKYVFNLEEFLSENNKFFIEYYSAEKEKTEEDLRIIQNKFAQLENLV